MVVKSVRSLPGPNRSNCLGLPDQRSKHGSWDRKPRSSLLFGWVGNDKWLFSWRLAACVLVYAKEAVAFVNLVLSACFAARPLQNCRADRQINNRTPFRKNCQSQGMLGAGEGVDLSLCSEVSVPTFCLWKGLIRRYHVQQVSASVKTNSQKLEASWNQKRSGAKGGGQVVTFLMGKIFHQIECSSFSGPWEPLVSTKLG